MVLPDVEERSHSGSYPPLLGLQNGVAALTSMCTPVRICLHTLGAAFASHAWFAWPSSPLASMCTAALCRLYLRPNTKTLKLKWIDEAASKAPDAPAPAAPARVVLERKIYREGWKGEGPSLHSPTLLGPFSLRSMLDPLLLLVS